MCSQAAECRFDWFERIKIFIDMTGVEISLCHSESVRREGKMIKIDLFETIATAKESGKNEKEVMNEVFRTVKDALHEMNIEEFGKSIDVISCNTEEKKYYVSLKLVFA